MKRTALLLAVALFTVSLTGCGCLRRVRGTLCPGAYCGSRAPILGSLRAPAPAPAPIVAAPQVVTAPARIIPRPIVQPQVCVPQCVPCCPCPTTVCDPCCQPCTPCCPDECSCYGESACTNYGGGCDGCDGPFGIQVAPGEYLGDVETSSSQWQGNSQPTDAGTDPGPAN